MQYRRGLTDRWFLVGEVSTSRASGAATTLDKNLTAAAEQSFNNLETTAPHPTRLARVQYAPSNNQTHKENQ